LLFAILFFSVSSSKLVTYLVPAFPMLAWIGAEAWSDPRRQRRGAWGVAIAYGALAIVCGAASLRPGRLAFLGDPRLIPQGLIAARALAVAWTVVAIIAIGAAWKGWRNIPWIAAFSFMPILLVLGGPVLKGYASSQSGEPLARAIASHDLQGRVRFEHCYSPGTDFVLGRRSQLVSREGFETTSNYQARYRASLERRGEWTPLETVSPLDSTMAVVRSSREAETPAHPGQELYRDGRFTAYVETPSPAPSHP
jgi:hypothetical protein